MGKLVFAALVLLAGVGAYAVLRRQSDRFGSGPLVLVPTAVLGLAIAGRSTYRTYRASGASRWRSLLAIVVPIV